MGDKGRHIERANANDANGRIVRREQKRAASLIKKGSFRLYTRRVHQRQSLVEDPSLGDCKDDWFSHNDRALRVAGGKGNMAENIGADEAITGAGLFWRGN
jgi:hypothetical protein